jgi:ATP-dependent RNA helicase DDX55/SPB4
LYFGGGLSRYIFQSKKLDLGVLATGFGLLHLPSMPEIRGGAAVAGFVPDSMNHNKIPYQNKAKEKHRQEALAKGKAADEKDPVFDKRRKGKESQEAWSKKKDQKARKEKRQARKAFAKNKALEAEDADTAGEDDWDEDDLAAEARAFKKLKQGKMTKAEYLKFNIEEGGL